MTSRLVVELASGEIRTLEHVAVVRDIDAALLDRSLRTLADNVGKDAAVTARGVHVHVAVAAVREAIHLIRSLAPSIGLFRALLDSARPSATPQPQEDRSNG